MSKPMRDYIFPKEVEFPDWSDDLRGMATEFWWKWIGPNTVGYDMCIQEMGELIDFAWSEKRGYQGSKCVDCGKTIETVRAHHRYEDKGGVWPDSVGPLCPECYQSSPTNSEGTR